MMLTAMDWVGVIGSRAGAKLTTAAIRTAAWQQADMVQSSRKAYLFSCSGMTSMFAPKPAPLMRPRSLMTSA